MAVRNTTLTHIINKYIFNGKSMIKVIIKKDRHVSTCYIRKSYSSQFDCIIADNYKFSKNCLFISFKIDNYEHLKKGITGFSKMNGTDGSTFIVGIKLP